MAGLLTALFLAEKYKIDLDRYGKYIFVVLLGLFLLAIGTFPRLYRLAVYFFHRRAKEDDDSDSA